MADAPCGCDLAESAAAMPDRRGAAVLEADAVLARAAWRCPRVGGEICPETLPETHRGALERVRRLSGCDDEDLRTCPGHYVRQPEAHEVVRLHRWLKAGALAMRCPNPSGAIVDALDELQGSLSAREADEIARMAAKSEKGGGGGR